MSGRVLLLGGAGFIGSALAPRLAAEGWEVIVAGRGADLESRLAGCAAVVHLACSTTPGSSRLHPLMERENLELSLHLLEALRSRPETQLVFLSSGGAIYGNPTQLPVAEDAPLSPLSWHAAGKAAMEALLAAYRSGPVTVLRVANAYGPSQPEKPGFGFIRTVLDCARSGRPLEIWGDGKAVRDFIYIDDVTAAIGAALSHPERPGTYNIGSGRSHSLNEVVVLAQAVTGYPIELIHHAPRQSDVRAVVLDITRAREVLEWAPATLLTEGLRVSWQASFPFETCLNPSTR
ncbi:MAG: NAD-dependent epimerase/dehydratase family protein [Rhodocyclaceae bacterium]|nr:NAD-dependent epimerase/dehydratase family protein [Rhodocyclaceae bacterium]